MVSSEFVLAGSMDEPDRKHVPFELQRRLPLPGNNVPSSTTCRCLFGIPEVTSSADVRLELERKHNDRWNFDFRTRQPLTSSEASYEWLRVGGTAGATSENRFPLSLLDNGTSTKSTTATTSGVASLRLVAVHSIRATKGCVDNGVRKASRMKKTWYLEMSSLPRKTTAAASDSQQSVRDVICRVSRKRKSRSILARGFVVMVNQRRRIYLETDGQLVANTNNSATMAIVCRAR